MNPYIAQQQSVPVSERLSLKLIGLFVGSLFAVFVGLWAYDALTSFAAARLAESAVVAQPSTVVIDPKLQDELARVMSFGNTPLSGDIKDPFNDRAGISNIARNATFAGGTQTAVSADTVAAGATNTGGSGSGGGAQNGAAPPAKPEITALEATRLRYANWLEEARLGSVYQIDPQIFAIEDLLPVGVVSGGEGTQEIMFYSQVADRTLSFPVGTRFNDGWLSELRPEGVVFSFWDEKRTIRLRQWSRTITPSAAG